MGGYLGWLLWWAPRRTPLRKIGVLLMFGLANAALWGGIFHALFPAGTATLPGFLTWIPVVLSISLAAAAMLDLGMRLLLPSFRRPARSPLLLAYILAFVVVVLFVRESYKTIVYFYTPAVLLLLLAAAHQATKRRDTGWTRIALGLIVSIVAAALQQAGIAVHPTYFDHNAVYHLVQALALLILYAGWRRATLPPETDRAHLR